MSADPITRLNAALEGRYSIESELGEGGMATVYLADDLKHERKVALKVLKPELAAAMGAARFLAEIKTTANLRHPHILPLFDSGDADGFLFYVIARSLRISDGSRVGWGVKVAVAAATAAGLVGIGYAVVHEAAVSTAAPSQVQLTSTDVWLVDGLLPNN